jgi:MFS family permease
MKEFARILPWRRRSALEAAASPIGGEMPLLPGRDKYGNVDVVAYANAWFVIGAIVGMIIGGLISVVWFDAWTAATLILIVVGCGLGAAVIARAAVERAFHIAPCASERSGLVDPGIPGPLDLD